MSRKKESTRQEALQEMKLGHQAAIERSRTEGAVITTWSCIHCDGENETVQPRPEQVPAVKGYYDYYWNCVECGGRVFLYVYPSGKTEVTLSADALVFS